MRHVAPIGRSILIPSQHVFPLTHLSCMLSEEAANTNCIVFCLTRAGLELTIDRTLTITPPIRVWQYNGSFHLLNNNSYSTLINVILLLNYCCISFWQIFFHSSLTVQSYARHLNILTNWTTAIGKYFVLKHCVNVILTVTACVSTDRITTINNSLNIMAEI